MFRTRDRNTFKRNATQLANNYSRAVLLIPLLSDAGNYDPISNAAIDVQNTTSYETGKTITGWKVVEMQARRGGATFTDLVLLAAGAGFAQGKIKLFFSKRMDEMMQEVVDDVFAYVYIDGQTYRPIGGIDNAGLFHADESFIELNSHTPRARATGY
jgi:hypothetical protein